MSKGTREKGAAFAGSGDCGAQRPQAGELVVVEGHDIALELSAAVSPPALLHTAARIFDTESGSVTRAVTFGPHAVIGDRSGRMVARSFETLEVTFSCRLRDERVAGLAVLTRDATACLVVCHERQISLFGLDRGGLVLLHELKAPFAIWSGEARADELWVAERGTRRLVGFRLARDGAGAPTLEGIARPVELDEEVDKPNFVVCGAGRWAIASADRRRLGLRLADGSLRWSRPVGFVGDIAVSPSGSLLAVVDGSRVWLLDIATGRPAGDLPLYDDLVFYPSSVSFVTDNLLALGCHNALALFERSQGGDWSPIVSPRWMVAGTVDAICWKGADILGIDDNSIVHCRKGSVLALNMSSDCGGHVHRVAFCGRSLVVGDQTGILKRLDLESLELEVEPKRHRRDWGPGLDPSTPQWCEALDYSAEVSLEVFDNEVCLNGDVTVFEGHLFVSAALRGALDCLAVGTTSGLVAVFAVEDGRLGAELFRLAAPSNRGRQTVNGLVFLVEDGREYLVLSQNNGTVASYLLEAEAGRLSARLAATGEIERESNRDTIISQSLRAVGGGFCVGVTSRSASFQYFAASDCRPLRPPLALGTSGTTAARFGDLFYYANGHGEIFEYDEARQAMVRSKVVASGFIASIALSPDGRLIAVGGQEERCVRLLDRASLEELVAVKIFNDEVLMFTPPSDLDRERGMEYGAAWNPSHPDPAGDSHLVWYHSPTETIRAGRGRRLDPADHGDLGLIRSFVATLYGGRAVQDGVFGRDLVRDALCGLGRRRGGARPVETAFAALPPPPGAKGDSE